MRAHRLVRRRLMKAGRIAVYPNNSIEDRPAPVLRSRPRSLKGRELGAKERLSQELDKQRGDCLGRYRLDLVVDRLPLRRSTPVQRAIIANDLQ